MSEENGRYGTAIPGGRSVNRAFIPGWLNDKLLEAMGKGVTGCIEIHLHNGVPNRAHLMIRANAEKVLSTWLAG